MSFLSLSVSGFFAPLGIVEMNPNVMQETVITIKAEQQRADDRLDLVVAEAAEHNPRCGSS